MRLEELPEYVDNFRRRVMADALQEATAHYWRKRAATFDQARPRAGDWPGRASPERLAAHDAELAAAALACRERAVVSLGGEFP